MARRKDEGSKDKAALIYNEFLTLEGIPPETFEYRLGNRSLLEWVIDQYQVSTDKRSGIANDPDIHDRIDQGIRLWDKVLLCASKSSLISWWVDGEINRAFQKEAELMKERSKLVSTPQHGHLIRPAAKQERKGNFESLRRGMRGLIGDLEDEFTADDARWARFGLDAPADIGVPDVVENVDVEEVGKGRLLVDWDPAARALRYQVDVQVVGVDQEFRRVATVKDEMAVLESISPNVTVKVRVTAVNDTGNGVASEVVEFQVSALSKAA